MGWDRNITRSWQNKEKPGRIRKSLASQWVKGIYPGLMFISPETHLKRVYEVLKAQNKTNRKDPLFLRYLGLIIGKPETFAPGICLELSPFKPQIK